MGIGYADDIDTACRVMLDAVRGIDGVKQDPPPDAVPWALDASTVNIKLRWWTDSRRASVVATQGKVIAAVKQALNDAGIDIAYPTRVVLFHDQTESTDGDRRRQREGWPAGEAPPQPRPMNHVVMERADEGSRRGIQGSA